VVVQNRSPRVILAYNYANYQQYTYIYINQQWITICPDEFNDIISFTDVNIINNY